MATTLPLLTLSHLLAPAVAPSVPFELGQIVTFVSVALAGWGDFLLWPSVSALNLQQSVVGVEWGSETTLVPAVAAGVAG